MRGRHFFVWGTSPLVSFFLRVFLGIVFLYAGVVKIADPHGFAQALSNYHLLPAWMISFMAIFLPWLETIVGASLLFGMMVKRGAFVATGLLAIFTVALVIRSGSEGRGS